MKLETEADDSLCLFISAERRISRGVESGGCSVVAGERAHSAQGSIDKLSGSPLPSVADHIIVAAARTTASGRGTPSAGESTPPTTNGFRNGHHHPHQLPETTTISSLINCEHFRFIDDEDANDDDDVFDGAAGLVGELPMCDDDDRQHRSNGIPDADNQRSDKREPLSSSIPPAGGEQPCPPDRHLQSVDCETQVEVSDLISDTSTNKTNSQHSVEFASPVNADNMGDEHKSKKEKRKKKDSDGERHHQQQPLLRPPVRCNCHNMKDLKSVLKKGQSSERNRKKTGRVTFDEAVTLYSDEFEDVQLLALRSAPEVNCAEVFYMFEPPIEYQDLLQPFEPPAEYRDPDTSTESAEVKEVSDTPNLFTFENKGEMIELKEGIMDSGIDVVLIQTPVAAATAESQVEKDAEQQKENNEPSEADITETAATETTNNSEEEKSSADPDAPVVPTSASSGPEVDTNPTEESEKLFERFLEAEREFAEDEELNRVFHVLEAGDFATNDEKSGTFDDNFFKKLISLLSSVEGDVQLREGDFFTTTDFGLNEEDFGLRASDIETTTTKEDDASQQHSRSMSEADSDCSVSSQDTIIVRLGDEDPVSIQSHPKICRQLSESDQSVENADVVSTIDEIIPQSKPEQQPLDGSYDDVFSDKSEITLSLDENIFPDEHLIKQQTQSSVIRNQAVKPTDLLNDTSELNRQNSAEQPPKDTVQDADDSTSSDSRSGEVEEDIRLDDIGYDEEDADDYDEECLRGMVRGNSKIRRIIKKNALQCTLLRGIEARRRGQPSSIKYPRPKSPPLSQESLVEQLKWLTTMDDVKEIDSVPTFSSKPPDVILSTGSVPLNGNMGHCPSSEDEMSNRPHHRLPQHYTTHQPRHVLASDGKGLYVLAQQGGGGYTLPTHGPPRPWHPVMNTRAQVPPQQQQPQPYAPRAVVHPMPSQIPAHQDSERLAAASPVPRDFRDWRVIQRVMMVDRGNGNNFVPRVGFRRCPNGSINTYYPRVLPPNVGRPLNMPNNDELEHFVQQDSQRIERIRKRYSVAEEEEEDDPTFGFARRPFVRGVQNRLPPADHQPSDLVLQMQVTDPGTKHLSGYNASVNELMTQQRPVPMRPRPAVNPELSWNRNPNWLSSDPSVGYSIPDVSGLQRAQPMPVHRASVALTDLSGCTTLPHPKNHSDPRYHSYAESAYGGSQTLPHKRWPSTASRSCLIPGGNAPAPLHHPMPRMSGPPSSNLQVPPTLPHIASDERGVPEGASSSPKVSSDSLYHAPPMQETVPSVGTAHKDDSVIYYSMNV